MKFIIAMQDMCVYDEVASAIRGVAKQSDLTEDEVWAYVSSFIGNGEFARLQFDTDDRSCRVLRTAEAGVDEYVPERNVVAKLVRRGDTPIAELQRRLDEAVNALSLETDKNSPAAINLWRFIIDTRDELKAVEQSEQNIHDWNTDWHDEDEEFQNEDGIEDEFVGGEFEDDFI
jgi:hypothetical protein